MLTWTDVWIVLGLLALAVVVDLVRHPPPRRPGSYPPEAASGVAESMGFLDGNPRFRARG